MEFHQIRYFLAAADHLNFTRAAESCGVSQPALTVAIRKLEDELGGTLFDREGGRIALTDLGRTMRTHLARVDETRRAAREAAKAHLGAASPEVALGVYSTIGPGPLARALGAFQTAHADVTLVLHDVWGPRAYEMLLSGAFDAAVVARHGPLPDRIEAVGLYTEPMVLAAPRGHPLARASVRVEDLAGATYFDRLRCEFRREIMDDLTRRGIALGTLMRAEPEDWVQSAVAAGQGVTILPRDRINWEGVVAVPIEDFGYERMIEVVTVEGRVLSPQAARLVETLAATDWGG